MPITDEKQYEAALEEAVERMEAGPHRASDDPRLMTLLAEIDAYRPTFDVPQPQRDTMSDRAQKLVERASAVKREMDERRTRWTAGYPQDGRGVGPTTGA